MKMFRVKQISENQFIPQIANGIINCLLGFWDGIDVDKNDVWHIWLSKEHQDIFCVTDSLDKAKEVIKDYKQKEMIDKRYPKYHKA
jgi:hypothetical protein